MRRIDHLVVAVHDLDRAAELYRDMGFQVGARNRHPWGTENHLVQFERSFIELITCAAGAGDVPPHAERDFSFGRFVKDYLDRREGLAMLCLDSSDAKADAAFFKHQGFGDYAPFFFERKGRRPDGTETHVAFTLAFARDEQAPDVAFFVCQQHFPDQFWHTDLQRHANGGTGISSVSLAAAEPEAHTAFLSGFSRSASIRGPGGNIRVGLEGSHIDVQRAGEAGTSPRLTSFAVRVSDTAQQAGRLDAAGIPFLKTGSCLTVPPQAAFGVGIAFEQANP